METLSPFDYLFILFVCFKMFTCVNLPVAHKENKNTVFKMMILCHGLGQFFICQNISLYYSTAGGQRTISPHRRSYQPPPISHTHTHQLLCKNVMITEASATDKHQHQHPIHLPSAFLLHWAPSMMSVSHPFGLFQWPALHVYGAGRQTWHTSVNTADLKQ